MNDETAPASLPADAHADAAAAFVDRARSRHAEEIVDLYVFGSTVRGDAHGRSSDVDILVVLDEAANRDVTADSLRDLALDVTIEYGPAVELHILSETTFARYRREGNPFIRNVVTEGRSYV
jgi:predicted nucleotidyltransferase